jgi:Helix-turn-helix domain
MNENKLFSISFDKEINHHTSEVENQIYLRVYKSMFTSGLVAKMKLHNFATLMAIASYMDEDGECYPTQSQLAERMGVHLNSVNKYVNQLLDFRIDGNPIISREIINQGRGKVSSYYKIHPISQLAIFNGEVESITKNVKDSSQDMLSTHHKRVGCKESQEQESLKNKEYTPKELITIFVNKYREVYGVSFNPSWGRDMSLMKTLITKYGEDVKDVIEVSIEEYDEKWKSPKFQRPTIGAISSFIGDQVMAVIEERRKQDEEFDEYEEKVSAVEEDMERKLSALDKLGGKQND